MKKITCFLMILVMAAFISCSRSSGTVAGADSGAPAVQKLRWGMATAIGVPLYDAAHRFADMFKEATNGSIVIDVYPQAQLGNERDLIEGVSMGTIDFCNVSGALTNFSSAFLTFDLPFIVKNTDAGLKKAYGVFDGPVGREVLDSLKTHDILGLGFWEGGFRHCLNSKRDVRTPNDIKGLKIRTMENEIHLAYYNAEGAIPVAIASSEAFTALQQGVIDGMDNNLYSFVGLKAYEAAKHLSLTSHFYSPAVIMMNFSLFNSFTAEQRDSVFKIEKDVKAWQRDLALEFDKKAMQEMRAAGVVIIDNIDYEIWQKACSGVYDLYRDKIDQKHLDAFLK
jgi:tripartite ATP-independent transporter DctP family solute receptor